MKRRDLLRGLSLGGLGGMGLVPLLNSERLSAQQETFPTRLLVFYSPNGIIWPEWVDGTSETNFQFGRLLAPLEPFRDRILSFKGIHEPIAEDNGIGSHHARGVGGLLTGEFINEGTFNAAGNRGNAGWANGISIDQHIANELSGATPFKSLELGVRVTDDEVRGRISYLGPDSPLPPENSPYAAFDRVFSNLNPSGDDGTLNQLREERRSILDYVVGEMETTRLRLPSDDRQKLDAHLESLREIERRLDGTVTSQTCEPVTLGAALDPLATENMPTIGQLQMDLAASALACNLTQITTLQWTWAESIQEFPWLDLPVPLQHHTTSHSGDTDADSQEALVRVNIWYMEQLAYLLQKLDSYQEGNGTLLDNTVVLYINEVAKGNTHQHTDLPFLLAGSAGGQLQTGRFVDYAGAGRNHNDLLVTLAQLMGVDIQTFGSPDYNQGPLPGLTV